MEMQEPKVRERASTQWRAPTGGGQSQRKIRRITAKGGLVSGTKASSEEREEDIQGVAKSQQEESEPEWSEEDIQAESVLDW